MKELTSSERRVLELHGRGMTYSEIAKREGISSSSVTSLMRRAKRKLGARTAAQAVFLYAFREEVAS
jgi:DNA-binding CsgD family transcriptional regulator